ncbi:hypothetical protein SDC9_209465 [bioreactor metagenome]|uniref:Uncharacterized protein n=1 Tax=bioreactor metagenome TaxID=1076179 RepID=A0A645JQA5_9ZZZZ
MTTRKFMLPVLNLTGCGSLQASRSERTSHRIGRTLLNVARNGVQQYSFFDDTSPRHAIDQCPGVRVHRMIEDIDLRALFYYFTAIHDRNVVSNLVYHTHVMRNIDE